MIYEYICDRCGHRTDERREISQRDLAPQCPSCYTQMRRAISAPNIVANLERDKPENKYALGFSERDRYEAAKSGEREYVLQQARNEQRIREERDSIIQPEPYKPMEQLARDMGVLDA